MGIGRERNPLTSSPPVTIWRRWSGDDGLVWQWSQGHWHDTARLLHEAYGWDVTRAKEVAFAAMPTLTKWAKIRRENQEKGLEWQPVEVGA